MAQPNPDNKIPFTVYLTADVAQRLKSVAESQNRSAAELAADLLDRNLPRLPSGIAKKGKVPYT